jgi:hypothetical protein
MEDGDCIRLCVRLISIVIQYSCSKFNNRLIVNCPRVRQINPSQNPMLNTQNVLYHPFKMPFEIFFVAALPGGVAALSGTDTPGYWGGVVVSPGIAGVSTLTVYPVC